MSAQGSILRIGKKKKRKEGNGHSGKFHTLCVFHYNFLFGFFFWQYWGYSSALHLLEKHSTF
jgi:hypothetical protein